MKSSSLLLLPPTPTSKMVKYRRHAVYPPLTPEVLTHINHSGSPAASWLSEHPISWNAQSQLSSISFSRQSPRGMAFHHPSRTLAVGLESQVQLFRQTLRTGPRTEHRGNCWELIKTVILEKSLLPESISDHPNLSFEVGFLQFSPSGKKLLLHVPSKRYEKPVEGRRKLIESGLFSPSLTFLVEFNSFLEAKIEFIEGRTIMEHSDHFSRNEDLIFLQDTESNKLSILDSRSLKDHSSLYPISSLGQVSQVVQLPSETILLTSFGNGTIKLSNPLTGESKGEFSGDSGFKYLSLLSPDSNLVVTASTRDRDIIRGFNLSTSKHEFVLRNLQSDRNRDGEGFFTVMSIDQAMNYLAIGDITGTLKIYDLTTRIRIESPLPTIMEKSLNCLHTFTFDPSSSSLLTSSTRFHNVQFPDFSKGRNAPIHSIHFNSDSSKIGFSFSAGGVVVYDFQRNELQGFSQPLPSPADSWKEGEEDEAQWKGWFKGGSRFVLIEDAEDGVTGDKSECLLTRGNDLLLDEDPKLRFWKVS